MTAIRLKWKKHNNFFKLWREHKNSTKLIYCIGEEFNCYIGCIGINDGKGGLKQRYQWQYIQRSLAIFNKKESDGQVSFSAIFKLPKKIDGRIIGATEAIVQAAYIKAYGKKYALFKQKYIKGCYKIEHSGHMPKFLKTRKRAIKTRFYSCRKKH